MILLASVLVALGVTLFLVSYIAKMLNAKRHGPGWIFVSWITGGIAASGLLLFVGLLLQSLDPALMMVISLVISLIAASAAYKYINQMSWGGAITTHISSTILGFMAVITALILNGNSLKNTMDSIAIATHQAATQAPGLNGINPDQALPQNQFDLSGKSVADDTLAIQHFNENSHTISTDPLPSNVSNSNTDEEPIESTPKEDDLLPVGAKQELAKAQKPYVSPKYHVVRIGNLRSLVGRQIRVHKSNGKVVAGALETIRAGDVVIKQRIHGGEAVIPVTISKIRKLEVYR